MSTASTVTGSPVFRLAKVVGVLAIAATAVSEEYGSGINYVAVHSLGVYPLAEYLVPLAMFATGIFLLPKVYLFTRFSRHMPSAGSSYVWLSRTLGLPVGFAVSFFWWLGLTAAIGVLGYVFGSFLGSALLDAGIGGGAFLLSPIGHLLVGLAAIWLIYGLHASGVQNYAVFITIALCLIVASALTIMGYGFATSPHQFISVASSAAGVSLAAPSSSPAPTFGAFLSVSTLFVFAYAGLTSAPSLGGEAKNPRETTPRGIFWAWAVALVLFTLVAYALFHLAPWWSILALIHAGKSSYATAPGLISLVSPQAVGVVLNLVVAVIVGKTIAPGMLASSRMVFAWGQDGVLPERFAHTTDRKIPLAALTLITVLGSLFLVQSSLIGWSIGVVVRSLGVLVVLGALGIGALNLKYNRKLNGAAWAQAIISGPGIVVASVLAIIIAVVMTASVAVVPNTPLVFQPLFQGVIVVLIAIWIYAAARRRARGAGRQLEAAAEEPPLE